ncbi:MAG: 4-hydroxy-tetrahydrodipicolinate synthase, partial [Oscillospiraceae bacterium]
MAIFKGCGTAIVTPMKKDESVDYEAFGELIDWQIENGVNAIIVCGTTGEASTLSDEEHVKVCKFCVDHVNKRVPVIAGAGSNNTLHAALMAEEMEKIGADALLLVTPYYNKCSQEGLIKHFFKIADSVNIPSIVYSVPSRTGVNILPQTALALSKHKNIVGIKEATGNISQVAEIIRLVPPEFGVYSGNDDMVVPVLSLGGV